MSDLTHQILTDRTAFPDDRKIILGDGQEVTVKEFREALMPKSDMTKLTEDWSRKERQLTDAYRGTEQQLRAAQQQLEQAVKDQQARTPANGGTPTGQVDEEELARDPVLGPMYKRMLAAEKRAEEAHQQLGEHGKALKSYRDTWQLANFQSQLERLRANPEYKDVNFDEFLTYSQRRPVLDTQSNNVDLESTMRNFNYNRAMQAAEARGEQRGVEKGKAAAAVPRVPMGRRRAAARPEGVPASFKDVDTDAVLADPDMQKYLDADHVIQ